MPRANCLLRANPSGPSRAASLRQQTQQHHQQQQELQESAGKQQQVSNKGLRHQLLLNWACSPAYFTVQDCTAHRAAGRRCTSFWLVHVQIVPQYTPICLSTINTHSCSGFMQHREAVNLHAALSCKLHTSSPKSPMHNCCCNKRLQETAARPRQPLHHSLAAKFWQVCLAKLVTAQCRCHCPGHHWLLLEHDAQVQLQAAIRRHAC